MPPVLELLARIDALLEQNRALLERIAELEARAGQPPKTPTNSSLPSSTGQKGNPEAPAGKKGRRCRPGVARALCPDLDQTCEIYAEACSNCSAALSPADQPYVHAYDHIDLPPIRPVTTRINVHSGNCPRCKRRVAAQPPADVAPGSPFGPGIMSVVTYLHACQMVSYSRMTEVLDGLMD